MAYFKDFGFGVCLYFREEGLEIFGADLFEGIEEGVGQEGQGDEGLVMGCLIVFPR